MKSKRSDVLKLGTRNPEMGIVPFEQNMLMAIHKSVQLLLTHTRRLVTQKEEVVKLYFQAKAALESRDMENAAMKSALSSEMAAHAWLCSHCRELISGKDATGAWNTIARIVGKPE